jgi:hypothetical protein
MLPRACSNIASRHPDALTNKRKAQLLANIDAGALDVDEVLWAYNMLTEELDAWRNGRGLCVTGRAVRGRRARRRRR